MTEQDLPKAQTSDQSDSDDTDTSSEDEDFEIGGKRGFNTNMDDFLENFGSISANPDNGIDRSRSTQLMLSAHRPRT